MISYEDRELEQMVISGNSCIAVPIEIYVPVEGDAQITVYSCFAKVAEEYESRFKNDLLSANALNWLDSKLYADAKMFGYDHCEDDIHMLCEYSITDASRLYKSDIEDVRIINSEIELAGLDITLIDGVLIDKTAAVIVRDNKLVSIACANDVPFEDNSIELFVETDADYRCSGFGAATVTALTKIYLEKGRIVRYKCAKNNAASVHLAEKCGFKKNGERYSYVCYANEENRSNEDF